MPSSVALSRETDNAMGLDFSALIRYPGPTAVVLDAISRLEHDAEDAAFAEVNACGLRGDFDFPKYACEKAHWAAVEDYEELLPERPTLPSLEWCLELPSSFSLTFGRDAIAVWHSLRWMYFVKETEWQQVMISAIKRFCDLLQAQDCIITSDENPAIIAFRNGASFEDALQAADQQGEGAVSHLGDLYIDEGYADDLVFEGPPGESSQVPLWDTHGYWRVRPLPGQPNENLD